MEEKYKSFTEFDWADERWQAYLSGLYPPPNYKQVVKYKKKWYTKNIDPEFDASYDPDISSSSSAATGGSQSNPSSSFTSSDGQVWAAMGPKAMVSIVSYVCGLGLAIASIVGLCDTALAVGMLAGGFMSEILGKHGFRLKQEYLQSVMQEEVGIMPFMGMILMMPGFHKAFRTLAIMPMGLAALVSLAMLCRYSSAPVPAMVRRLLTPLTEVSARYQLMQLRSDTEVMLGVTLTVGAFMRLCAPLTTVLYWNIITMRYALSPWTQASFRKVDGVLSPVLGRIPGVSSLYVKFKNMLHNFAVPGERGGSGMRCSIL